MSSNIKKTILISLGVATTVLVGILIYNRFKKPLDNTPQGFNELIERVAKKHPELMSWWEGLPIEKQIVIENTMTPELLDFLSQELTKKEISEQAKNVLRKAGYVG